ncbi:MAG: GNAT family N-acetyltransferase [Actinomycetota bacterium]
MDVSAIERAAATAWPAAETEILGEWVLSAGDGFSRRRNSAVPIGVIANNAGERVDEVVSWYRERGITPRFRITPMCDREIDDLLEERGFVLEDPVLVMTRSLEHAETPPGIVEKVRATDDWIEAELNALDIDRSLISPWLDTLSTTPSPVVFTTATERGSTVGAGFGVVVDDLLGSFELAVEPKHRRKGHATRLMDAIHAFGRRNGAQHGFLQVVEENHAAVALYTALGYDTVYRYWYRVNNA